MSRSKHARKKPLATVVVYVRLTRDELRAAKRLVKLGSFDDHTDWIRALIANALAPNSTRTQTGDSL